MIVTNHIGLETKKADALSKQLNKLLANYSIFYQNVRGYHWNIKGSDFFELHVKFEELYNDLLLKIDEIAERILTLGHSPIHRYSDYTALSQISESAQISEGAVAIEDILLSFRTLIQEERELLKMADDATDEGTIALMSDYIQQQEKLVWMYSAYLG